MDIITEILNEEIRNENRKRRKNNKIIINGAVLGKDNEKNPSKVSVEDRILNKKKYSYHSASSSK